MTGATIPEGSVVITPIEMYREMQATHQAVRDVSGKLDGALEAHTRRLDDHDKDFADHEGRLRHVEQTGATKKDVATLEREHAPRITSLERRVWMASGVTGLLVAGASAIATIWTAGR